MTNFLELQNTNRGAGYLSPGEASVKVTGDKSLKITLTNGQKIYVGHPIEDIYRKLELPYLLNLCFKIPNN